MCWLRELCGRGDPELLHLDKICGSVGTAVDVGANWGSYTYPLSKRFRRVYAFEINDEVTGWIKQYNSGNIELVHCGLSSTAGTARFYVPMLRGVSLTAMGSLDRDNAPEADKYLEKEVRLAPLDDFGITGVGFLKIDVEGHEVEVLKGANATIRQSRPVVLIEVRDMNTDRNLHVVDSWFLELGYRQCRLDDFIGVHGSAENYIYVPGERLAEFGISS
jgi:FkbM family methyltransferase